MSNRIIARALQGGLFSLVLGGMFPGLRSLCPTATRWLLEDAPVPPALSAGRPCGVRRRSRTGSRSRPNSGRCWRIWHRAISRSPVPTPPWVNAIFVIAPASRLDELKSIPGVAAVRPMRRFKASLNRATQLMNAPLAWNSLGGAANAGKG